MGRQLESLDYPSEASPDEVTYRPTSPMATTSLVVGIISALSMTLAEDVGAIGLAVMPILGILLGIRGLSSAKRYDMAGSKLAKIGMVLSIVSLFGGEALRAYVVANEAPPGSIKIAYEDLQSQDPMNPIPPAAKELDGKKVYIKGYVYPGKEQRGIKSFVLCRDNGDCCFGGQPKLNDMIEVTLKEPLTLDYDTRMRRVAGVFKVQEKQEGTLGRILYQMEADFLQ